MKYLKTYESFGNTLKTFAKDAFKVVNGKSVEEVRTGKSDILWYNYLWDYILETFKESGVEITKRELHERLLEFNCYTTTATWDDDEEFGYHRTYQGKCPLDVISLNSLFDYYNVPFDEDQIRYAFKRDPLKYSNFVLV